MYFDSEKDYFCHGILPQKNHFNRDVLKVNKALNAPRGESGRVTWWGHRSPAHKGTRRNERRDTNAETTAVLSVSTCEEYLWYKVIPHARSLRDVWILFWRLHGLCAASMTHSFIFVVFIYYVIVQNKTKNNKEILKIQMLQIVQNKNENKFSFLTVECFNCTLMWHYLLLK